MSEPRPPQLGQPQETPKGRRICAWCEKDMGPVEFESEKDTHGICEECAVKVYKDLESEK